jgi:hypothetical protein
MAEINILTPGTIVRILSPLAAESVDSFQRRMQAMVAVLSECSPEATAVVIIQPTSRPVCIVTQMLNPT